MISVAFSPDGKYVVSGSYDNTARVWEASTGKEIARLTHDGAVNSVAFSPDGRTLASGSHDNTIRLWRVPDDRSSLDRCVLAGRTLREEAAGSVVRERLRQVAASFLPREPSAVPSAARSRRRLSVTMGRWSTA